MALSEGQQNELARTIQNRIPWERRPFRTVADTVGLSEAEVIDQLRAWDADGKLREISAVLEGSTLGYESALVAAAIPEEELERVAAVVGAHPTVTHNYRREHHFNLWFTIAVPESMGLTQTLQLLEREAGVERFHALPRTHTFKIGVNFDLKRRDNNTERVSIRAAEKFEPNEAERAMLRALQTPLPYVESPFDELASLAGTDADALLEFAARVKKQGVIRRYVATFRHRKLGVRGNGMGVWDVPVEALDEIGPRMAAYPDVSHCYARSSIPGFDYRLYSMIHGPDEDAVRRSATAMSEEFGIDNYVVLFSTREFKKCRLRYFLPELDAWWEQRAKGAA